MNLWKELVWEILFKKIIQNHKQSKKPIKNKLKNLLIPQKNPFYDLNKNNSDYKPGDWDGNFNYKNYVKNTFC